MRVRTEDERNLVNRAMAELKGSAVLVNGKNGREYDLKDIEARKTAVSLLMSNDSDNMEIYVNRREDMEIMIGLIGQLQHKQTYLKA